MKSIKYLIFLLPIILAVSVLIFFLISFTKTNVLETDFVYPGVGWKNNTSLHSGSELSFAFHNSSSISFKFFTNSDADQDLELFVNDIKYIMSSPNLKEQELKIKLDKNKPYTVTVRHTCSQIEHTCHVEAKGIYVDRGAKLTNYQRHNKVLSVLGDSISTIYGKDNFTQILSDRMGYELHNPSVNGAAISRTDAGYVFEYEKDLKNYFSDVIIIYLGSNDAFYNASLEEFRESYTRLITNIKTDQPKAKIILASPLLRNDVNKILFNEYTEVISRIAVENSLTFIDTSEWLNENDYTDGIHPTLESQQKLVNNFEEKLNPILK